MRLPTNTPALGIGYTPAQLTSTLTHFYTDLAGDPFGDCTLVRLWIERPEKHENQHYDIDPDTAEVLAAMLTLAAAKARAHKAAPKEKAE